MKKQIEEIEEDVLLLPKKRILKAPSSDDKQPPTKKIRTEQKKKKKEVKNDITKQDLIHWFASIIAFQHGGSLGCQWTLKDVNKHLGLFDNVQKNSTRYFGYPMGFLTANRKPVDEKETKKNDNGNDNMNGNHNEHGKKNDNGNDNGKGNEHDKGNDNVNDKGNEM